MVLTPTSLYKKKEKERRFECEDVPETAEIS